MQLIIQKSQFGVDEIYDPKQKCTPKTKLIFKIEKHQGYKMKCYGGVCQHREIKKTSEADCGQNNVNNYDKNNTIIFANINN